MRAAGYEPKGEFPGKTRNAWLCTCTGCGQLRTPSLDSVRQGKRCLHSAPPTAGTRIRRAVTGRIADGTYLPGSRIPSATTLATEFGVTSTTILRALAPLTKYGLLYSSSGRDGTRVHPRALTRLKPHPCRRRPNVGSGSLSVPEPRRVTEPAIMNGRSR
ncbi:GntR family transcriptional regulator [Streptomyces sp. NPDC101455]|uniref:GntR family transcriptional regulator n=1 Tax=Streptomyces sp. NPDC101455 TaxID=3366142 RepID=UPI0038041497